MPDSADHNSDVPQTSTDSLCWQSWPVREQTLRSLLVTAGLLVGTVVVYLIAGRVVLSLLALAAVMTALWRFFVPVQFELSEVGLGQRILGRQRRIPWHAIARYDVCSDGVLLSPEEELLPMTPLRALYLPWTTHREEVLCRVRCYLDPRRKEPESTRSLPAKAR